MKRGSGFLPSLALILCLALSPSFHGELAHAQDFNFPADKLDSGSFTSVKGGAVDSSGTLTLNATGGDAHAFYASPFNLVDKISGSVHSFSTFFTFTANATTGNGTLAFVMVPEADETGGLAAARATMTIEFNTSCSGAPFNNGSYGNRYNGGGMGDDYRRGGPGGRGFFGGFGGFLVLEYANNTQISVNTVSGYGPAWDGTPANPPYFCQQAPPDLDDPSFQFQVVLEYNASTEIMWVGSPSCGASLARTTQFNQKDLSSVLNKPVYVGFIVTGGGTYELSQWNFTSNATSSSVSNLALSSTVSTTPAGVSDGAPIGRRSGHGLGKAYVVGFSLLGAAIGVALVAGVCCLCCAKRRRRSRGMMFVAKGAGTIPESQVVFDASKPPTAPVRMGYDRDTAPLNSHPDSSFHTTSTGGVQTWLHPVAPR